MRLRLRMRMEMEMIEQHIPPRHHLSRVIELIRDGREVVREGEGRGEGGGRGTYHMWLWASYRLSGLTGHFPRLRAKR